VGRLDIGIAGCGIAGLAAGLLLARDGHNVTFYERFQQPEPVGSGLLIQPTGLAVLEGLELTGQVVSSGARVRRLFGEDRNGEAVLDTRYADLKADGIFAVGIHRAALFDALFGAAKAAGIPFHTGHEVVGATQASSRMDLAFAAGCASASHELVIDCLGVSSPLAPSNGGWLPFGALWTNVEVREGDPFKPDVLEQRYDRAARMVGVLPVGGGKVALFWSLKAAVLDSWRTAGLVAWKEEVAQLWPACDCLLERIADPNQLTFARYAHRLTRRPVEGRLVHIGDAWHAASPQLGQGANMALLDAAALNHALARADSVDEALATYASARRWHVRVFQALSLSLTPFYQSDSAALPFVRDRMVAALARIPPGPQFLAAMVAGTVVDPFRRIGLAELQWPAAG